MLGRCSARSWATAAPKSRGRSDRSSSAAFFVVVQLARPCSACGAHCSRLGLASRRKLAETKLGARQVSACACGPSWYCLPVWQGYVASSVPGCPLGYVYSSCGRELCGPPALTLPQHPSSSLLLGVPRLRSPSNAHTLFCTSRLLRRSFRPLVLRERGLRPAHSIRNGIAPSLA